MHGIASLCVSQCSTVIRRRLFFSILFFLVLQDKFKMHVFAWVYCSDGLSFQYSNTGQICEERSKNVKGSLKYLILFLKWLNSNLFCCFAQHSLKKSWREVWDFFLSRHATIFQCRICWFTFFLSDGKLLEHGKKDCSLSDFMNADYGTEDRCTFTQWKRLYFWSATQWGQIYKVCIISALCIDAS